MVFSITERIRNARERVRIVCFPNKKRREGFETFCSSKLTKKFEGKGSFCVSSNQKSHRKRIEFLNTKKRKRGLEFLFFETNEKSRSKGSNFLFFQINEKNAGKCNFLFFQIQRRNIQKRFRIFQTSKKWMSKASSLFF
jgi:hypothetical protein